MEHSYDFQDSLQHGRTYNLRSMYVPVGTRVSTKTVELWFALLCLLLNVYIEASVLQRFHERMRMRLEILRPCSFLRKQKTITVVSAICNNRHFRCQILSQCIINKSII